MADNILSIHTMKKRRHKPPVRNNVPAKLLTLSDLPKRVSIARRKELEGRKQKAMATAALLRPKVFADYVQDGAWKGRRCFIIGGGPSAKNIDFDRLQGELTIGINRAYEVLSPTILFGVDGQLFGWAELGKLGEESKYKFQAYKGFKVWMALHEMYPPDMYLIDPDEGEGYRIGTTRRLAYKNNSGYGAINLAAALGANPIYLIGFDMQGDRKGKQKWWHNGYPIDYGEDIYKRYIEELNNFAPVLKEAGVEVVNLNKKSALKCFTFGDFKKVTDYKPEVPAGSIQVMPNPDLITAITPTGDRVLAFELCKRWVAQQSRRIDQWIVVDDGKVPMKPPVGCDYIRRQPQESDPEYTLNLNIQTAIPKIRGSKILILEDDEYYAPGYVEFMSRMLDSNEVAGLCNSRYYHLATGGYTRLKNMGHASLAQTGFRSTFVPALSQLVLTDIHTYLDIRIWATAMNNGCGYVCIDDPECLYIGIKGLPGRGGIGQGHNPAMYGKRLDRSRKLLKDWAGKNATAYMDIVSGNLNEQNCKYYWPQITGLTVCHNTKDLMQRAYESVRAFHPDMPIIIINGSDRNDACTAYVESLKSDLTTVVTTGYNIGHGRGMCLGIDMVRTPMALIFDSDIEMLKSPVQAMADMMEPDTYGVGYTEKTGFDGYEYGAHLHHAGQEHMRMLHPYFQLISVSNYYKFHPYVHHGAPCYLAALDIHKQGLTDKIIKEFPGLGHSSGKGHVWEGKPREFIRHDPAGTRSERVRRGQGEIEGGWVLNRGQV